MLKKSISTISTMFLSMAGKFRFTMKMKLILSFAVLLILFSGVSTFGRYQVDGIHQQIIVQNKQMDKQQLALELKVKTHELDALKSSFFLSKNDSLVPLYNEKKDQFNRLVEQMAATATDADQRKWSSRLTNVSKEFTAIFDSGLDIINQKNIKTLEINEQLIKLHEQSQVHKEYIFELVDQFNQVYAQEALSAMTKSDTLLNQSSNFTLLSIIIVFIISIGIALLLIRSFIQPISRLQLAVKRLAEGDLTSKIENKTRDELGELSFSFDQMVDQVRGMLQSTQLIASSLSDHSHASRELSNATASANKEIVRAIQEISAGAEQQAYHTEQSAATISELAKEVKEIANFTQTMQLQSIEAAKKTESGSVSMEQLKTASQESEDVLNHAYSAMEMLSQSSIEIGKVVNSISEISKQTNVLSLNASIEAARAGAHGKGFSVIAEEVRILSTQTNESSKMIVTIVQSLLEQVKGLEFMLGKTKNTFGVQNEKMSESIEAFKHIRMSIDELNGQILQIHGRVAAAEHKNDQLVDSIQHVAAIAEETAAGVQEVNSSSQQQDAAIHRIASEADGILGLADELFGEINKFAVNQAE